MDINDVVFMGESRGEGFSIDHATTYRIFSKPAGNLAPMVYMALRRDLSDNGYREAGAKIIMSAGFVSMCQDKDRTMLNVGTMKLEPIKYYISKNNGSVIVDIAFGIAAPNDEYEEYKSFHDFLLRIVELLTAMEANLASMDSNPLTEIEGLEN